jgi:Fe-S oxidoreductase
MAKLKYEFLDKYYKANKRPLRSKVFAHINRVSRWGARLPSLANWGMQSGLGRMVMGRVLGVHPQRTLPAITSQTFPHWFASRMRPDDDRLTKGTVALFNDTFMNYNYPEIGQAAVELLEAAGFRVELVSPSGKMPSGGGCCGRPMISKGFLDEAAVQAGGMVEMLHSAYAARGIPIVGCEPSCVLTFRDEYPELVPGDKSRRVAQHTFLLDEFLVSLQERGELELELTDLPKKVLFHAHCHQKSLVGTANSLGALRLAPGYQVEMVNSGCCGMAGSFGFEKEHYEVSMQIGEQTLFPAVRAKGDDWEIAVTGVSCRQQVGHGTGRRARHLVEVLRDALP